MKRIRGRLLRKKPYKIGPNGKSKSIKTVLHEMCNLKTGDFVYQEIDDKTGIILLIPKDIFEKDNL